jgi:hypothetical protein
MLLLLQTPITSSLAKNSVFATQVMNRVAVGQQKEATSQL